jgi:hypothetical protein
MTTALEHPEALVPGVCPTWCKNEHQQAIDEGCDPETARLHRVSDIGGFALVPGGEAGERHDWNLWLLSEPFGHRLQFTGTPFLELELTSRPLDAEPGEDRTHYTARLDTGAARVLARQLIHFADLGDLS